MPNPVGRPSSYTPQLAESICEMLADGHSLRAICKGKGMPSRWTVFHWLDQHEDFLAQYTRARQLQADLSADEIRAIADDGDLAPDDRRVRIDARKWIACKLHPRVYGERQQHEVSGAVSITLTGSDERL